MKELLTAIKAKVNATTPALSALVGKTFAGQVADKASRPYAAVSLTPKSTTTGAYGLPAMLEMYPIQFSVWANGLVAASDLLDAIITAFNETSLTLSSGVLLRGRYTGRGFLAEGKDADSAQVFQTFATFEFTVQNS